jgi:hypothetical protein
MAGELRTVADLKRLAVETYRAEFHELSDNWRNLDSKAQGLGALAGIFLAAVFALTRDVPEGFGPRERWMLAAATFLLVVAVGAAVLALLVRRTVRAPLGQTADFIDLIVTRSKPRELPARIDAFYNDQITLWKRANNEMRTHLPKKAEAILWGQGALVVAAALVAVLAVGGVLGFFDIGKAGGAP